MDIIMYYFGYMTEDTAEINDDENQSSKNIKFTDPTIAIFSKYRRIKTLTESPQTETILANNIKTNDTVIIKKLTPLNSFRAAEFSNLKKLRGAKGVVQLIEHFGDPKDEFSNFYLVLEYIKGQDLHSHIISQKLQPAEIAPIFRSLVEIMYNINDKFWLVHRDLKPENVIISVDSTDAASAPTVTIIDWGFAFIPMPGKRQKSCGSPGYASPELITGDFFGSEIDVWSLGCILYIMLAKKFPFETIFNAKNEPNLRTLFENIKRFNVNYVPIEDSCALDLLKNIFVPAIDRFNLREILEHDYVGTQKTA